MQDWLTGKARKKRGVGLREVIVWKKKEREPRAVRNSMA